MRPVRSFTYTDVGFDTFEPIVQKKPASQRPLGEDMLYSPQYDPGVQSKHSVTLCLPREGLYVPGGHADGKREPKGQYEPTGQV